MKSFLTFLILSFVFVASAQKVKFLSSDSLPIKNVLVANIIMDEIYGDRKQEIVIIGSNLDKDGITQAIDSCIMTPNEIKSFDIENTIIKNSPDNIEKNILNKKTDSDGNVFLCTEDGSNSELLDPFPKWIN